MFNTTRGEMDKNITSPLLDINGGQSNELACKIQHNGQMV